MKHGTLTYATLRRGLVTMGLGVLGLTGLGCSHPCDTLEERLCADLGPEGCVAYRAAPQILNGPPSPGDGPTDGTPPAS